MDNTKKLESETILTNSLTGLTSSLLGDFQTSQLSSPATLYTNNRYSLVFYDRQLLSQLYTEHGIIQTLIDQPVDDGFRGGIRIKSDQLDTDEIEYLENKINNGKYIQDIKQGCKWMRLYGGGGLIIMTEQDHKQKFDINKVNKHSTIEFYPADLWELNLQYLIDGEENSQQLPTAINPTGDLGALRDQDYNFYGQLLDRSFVFPLRNKEAPSFIRRRMRGWGMTEVERIVRSINQYFKNNNVIFELLDEAKVDIYKIDQFNQALLTQNGTNSVQKRIQMANMVKSHLNALVMDKNDEFEQKQMNFAGLSEMLQQIRIGIASDLKMPVTKLFGVSSAGFNSGEDDIENYNSMIESEIRSKVQPVCVQVAQLLSKKYFDIVPDDLHIEFEPLRVLSAEQQENVKTMKMTNILNAFGAGILDSTEAREMINKDNLLPTKVDVSDNVYQQQDLEESETFTSPTDTSKTRRVASKAPDAE